MDVNKAAALLEDFIAGAGEERAGQSWTLPRPPARDRRNGDEGVACAAGVLADVDGFAVAPAPVVAGLGGKILLSCGMVRCLAAIKLTGFST